MKGWHITTGGVLVYMVAGVAVAWWTADRASKSQPAFNGFSAETPPHWAMIQTVAAWPYAAYYNLTH